ncbi:CBS domain-containing protein [Aquibacillus albus]|uniref:CBS domain-containing protein n=1 Tax=Aquibacillus albus TaxID=1168171 RepID=A0ABS2MW42_9BACI|nr:CBS domain-containing protein [Aquibacillus albus]MBM7570112.1 CBS domain-containing protein [Aquibacillus albus]
MKAHHIMKSQVIKVKEEHNVRSVIEKFIEHGISGLPVVNDSNEITGYISDGDIMRYIGSQKQYLMNAYYIVNIAKGDDQFEDRTKSILNLNVMELAKKTIYKVNWDESVEHVAYILGKKQIKKLPVERNGRLVGVISRGDVIRNSFKKLL